MPIEAVFGLPHLREDRAMLECGKIAPAADTTAWQIKVGLNTVLLLWSFQSNLQINGSNLLLNTWPKSTTKAVTERLTQVRHNCRVPGPGTCQPNRLECTSRAKQVNITCPSS